MTDEDDGRKLIRDLEYLVRSNNAAAERRGAASFRHAPGPFQAEQEIDVCSDLGDSLFDHGKGDLRRIRKNDIRNFPDCLAELNGMPIGIEVYELMDPDQAHTPWPIDRFSREVSRAIQNKDSKAGQKERPDFIATLSQLILVIHTDETALTSEVLANYLRQLRFPKPRYIDQAFVLGPFEPDDRPVIRGREREVAELEPRSKAFAVAWIDAGQSQK